MKTFDWSSEDFWSYAHRGLTRVGVALCSLALVLACSSQPCETPVAGSQADWHHKGQFKGYRAGPGCAGTPVVVVGTGDQWLDGVPPSDHTRKRLVAITGFYSRFLEKHQKDIASWNGFSHGRACLAEGEFAVVVLHDWRDVDLVARLVGDALASANLKERVGIRLAPLTCSEPTKTRR